MKLFARKSAAPDVRTMIHVSGRHSNVVRIEPTTPEPILSEREMRMRDLATRDLSALNGLSGFLGACLVDGDSGMMIAQEGGDHFDLETAAAANADVVKAKMRAMKALALDDTIEDILISLSTQYHIIRPLSDDSSVFFYVALDRAQANLAMARVTLRKLEKVA